MKDAAGKSAERWLGRRSAEARGGVLAVAGLGLAGTACGIAQASCAAGVLAAALTGNAPGRGILLFFAASMLARTGLQFAGDRLAWRVGARARRELRAHAARGVLQAGPALLRRVHSAALAVALADRVESLEGLFARWRPAAILAVAAPLLVAAMVAWRDPWAGVVLMACGAGVPAGMALAGLGAAAATRRQFQALTRLQTRFVDRLRGIASIVLANRAADEEEALNVAAGELRRRTMRVLRVAFLSSATLDCAAAATLVILATRAALALAGGDMERLARSLFEVLLVAEFFAPLRAFSAAYQDRMSANAAAEALAALPEADMEAEADPSFSPPPQGVEIRFEEVAWRPDPDRPPVLDGVSFTVAPGETALLIGESGSGKTSILEMALGFARPDSGGALLNGIPIARMRPRDLAALTAWIGQSPALFAGTIRENILLARPNATQAQLLAATRAARLEPLLRRLPMGLETMMGENGYGLSGGEAQRVAIARAFLKDAPLLLLDEPTTALDPDAEAEVIESLRRLAVGRTVLLASHSAEAQALPGHILQVWRGRVYHE